DLIKKYVMPQWRRRLAKDIRRKDVRRLFNSIDAPILANQVKAAASAVFTWAMKQDILDANACSGIESHPTEHRDRERILSDAELPQLWNALDDIDPVFAAMLRTVLLTGQRPGEVAHMRREHIGADGFWEMPGLPNKA